MGGVHRVGAELLLVEQRLLPAAPGPPGRGRLQPSPPPCQGPLSLHLPLRGLLRYGTVHAALPLVRIRMDPDLIGSLDLDSGRPSCHQK